MKIGFVSLEKADRMTSASLHSYYEAKALCNQGLEVYFLSPLILKQTPNLLVRRAFSRLFRGRRLLPDRNPALVTDLARQIRLRLKETPVDMVFSHGTIPIGLLDCPQPVIFWSDATFAGMLGFYPGFDRLDPATLRNGNQLEQSALQRAALCIYSSEWAASSCKENYKVDDHKVKVIPFGANLAEEPPVREVEEQIRARTMQPCRLVFVGTEWERKGGNQAVALAASLQRFCLPTELEIIGCKPVSTATLPDNVKIIGYVDTTTPTGQDAYRAHLAQAHFLVLPTRADCSPRVLYEAGAMGLPCLTTDVGGIGEIIRTGINGDLFPVGDGFVDPAARFVLDLMSKHSRYRELALHSLEYHTGNHTWEKSARSIRVLLDGISPAR
jgi:glycosyltransferase involved in cell wall biosynthesis